MKVRIKYTREILEDAVRSSLSFRQVLKKCGARDLTGGTHAHVSRMIRKFGINTGHFLGQGHNIGAPSLRRKDASAILVFHPDKSRNKSAQITRALLEIGRPYKCYICGLQQWRKKKIVLEIEHKDGDFQNDTEGNVEFICPNCHSQTATFCRIKNGSPRRVSTQTRTITRKASDDGYWRTRDKPHLRKIERPSVEQLAADIKAMPMIHVGAKYGVSDNAVRKWAKRYGLNLPKLRGRSKMAKRLV